MKLLGFLVVFLLILFTLDACESTCDVQYRMTMSNSEIKYVWIIELEGDMIKIMPRSGMAYYIQANTVDRIDFIGCEKLSNIQNK